MGKGKTNTVYVTRTITKFVSSDKGKGKGKGKGKKGKGKGKRGAAPLNSNHWEKKLEEESRKVVGSRVYSGTIQRYNWKFGYGFITPDNPGSLPKNVKGKLQEMVESEKEKGKEVDDENLLYFRKPDVNHTEGFKLGEGVAVTFCVYVDEKGAGAYEVSMPVGE